MSLAEKVRDGAKFTFGIGEWKFKPRVDPTLARSCDSDSCTQQEASEIGEISLEVVVSGEALDTE